FIIIELGDIPLWAIKVRQNLNNFIKLISFTRKSCVPIFRTTSILLEISRLVLKEREAIDTIASLKTFRVFYNTFLTTLFGLLWI
ncbi:hypothetical protein QNI16_37665, partial [Cytophagaceae bacterium YF14B1]